MVVVGSLFCTFLYVFSIFLFLPIIIFFFFFSFIGCLVGSVGFSTKTQLFYFIQYPCRFFSAKAVSSLFSHFVWKFLSPLIVVIFNGNKRLSHTFTHTKTIECRQSNNFQTQPTFYCFMYYAEASHSSSLSFDAHYTFHLFVHDIAVLA